MWHIWLFAERQRLNAVYDLLPRFCVAAKLIPKLVCLNADRPTEVQLGIYINSFYSISEQTMVRAKTDSC